MSTRGRKRADISNNTSIQDDYSSKQSASQPPENRKLTLNLNKQVATYIEKLRQKNDRLNKKLADSLDKRKTLRSELNNCKTLFKKISSGVPSLLDKTTSSRCQSHLGYSVLLNN